MRARGGLEIRRRVKRAVVREPAKPGRNPDPPTLPAAAGWAATVFRAPARQVAMWRRSPCRAVVRFRSSCSRRAGACVSAGISGVFGGPNVRARARGSAQLAHHAKRAAPADLLAFCPLAARTRPREGGTQKPAILPPTPLPFRQFRQAIRRLAETPNRRTQRARTRGRPIVSGQGTRSLAGQRARPIAPPRWAHAACSHSPRSTSSPRPGTRRRRVAP